MKYAVLFIALLFVGCGESSTIVDGYETFTIAGKTIQVAKEDFPEDMSWDDAMAACQNLGNGWRLPTKAECEAIHNQLWKKEKVMFNKKGDDLQYWSSTEAGMRFGHDCALTHFFFDDAEGLSPESVKSLTLPARAVRTLP